MFVDREKLILANFTASVSLSVFPFITNIRWNTTIQTYNYNWCVQKSNRVYALVLNLSKLKFCRQTFLHSVIFREQCNCGCVCVSVSESMRWCCMKLFLWLQSDCSRFFLNRQPPIMYVHIKQRHHRVIVINKHCMNIQKFVQWSCLF